MSRELAGRFRKFELDRRDYRGGNDDGRRRGQARARAPVYRAHCKRRAFSQHNTTRYRVYYTSNAAIESPGELRSHAQSRHTPGARRASNLYGEIARRGKSARKCLRYRARGNVNRVNRSTGARARPADPHERAVSISEDILPFAIYRRYGEDQVIYRLILFP